MDQSTERESRRGGPRVLHYLCLSFLLVPGLLIDRSMAQLYGNGSDGAHTVIGVEHLTSNVNYTDLTVDVGAILETHGFEVRVSGTLINAGTITDSYTGGTGGSGGFGGSGGGAGNGSNGSNGNAGLPGAAGTGSGGNGGGGGGGGGGAHDANDNETAFGGNGGNGGTGGRGGGAVRIWARELNNLGTIHANGLPAGNGGTGGTGGYNAYTEALIINRDLAGGGGGGGGGGMGGNGGTVVYYFQTLVALGTITANGGNGGNPGNGGSGRNTQYNAGGQTTEYNGGGGAVFDANGGSGARGEIDDIGSANGGSGTSGSFGSVSVVTWQQSSKCYADTDLDGFGDAGDPGLDVVGPCGVGFSTNNLDCDDTENTTYPGATEIVDDGIDQNCDGVDNITCYADTDGDGFGNATSPQVFVGICGGGYVSNGIDNCPSIANPGQSDNDGDGDGNACDNCPSFANANQSDIDLDAVGDLCDNCPTTANPGQEDSDFNGIGDVCCCGADSKLRGDFALAIDGVTDGSDLQTCVEFVFFNDPTTLYGCLMAQDVNDDLLFDGGDLGILVDYIFFNDTSVIKRCDGSPF